jgi:hypothetical protein
MKIAVLRDVTACGSCNNRRFGGTSVITEAIQRNIPEDILKNAKFSQFVFGCKYWILA